MNRTDRLYAITEELRRWGGRGRTAEQLAGHFEVSARTVKRDVSALQQAGVPVWAQHGPGGGYVLDAAHTLPACTFTPQEAAAIAVALSSAPGLPYAADGASALGKVLGAMAAPGRADAARLSGQVWLRLEDAGRDAAVTRAVEQAMTAGTVVVLSYRDATGTTTRRPVEPLGWARTRGRWYLLAWCRRRRAGRWFRLDRITASHPTREACPPRDLAAVFGPLPPDVVSAGATHPGPATPA